MGSGCHRHSASQRCVLGHARSLRSDRFVQFLSGLSLRSHRSQISRDPDGFLLPHPHPQVVSAVCQTVLVSVDDSAGRLRAEPMVPRTQPCKGGVCECGFDRQEFASHRSCAACAARPIAPGRRGGAPTVHLLESINPEAHYRVKGEAFGPALDRGARATKRNSGQ